MNDDLQISQKTCKHNFAYPALGLGCTICKPNGMRITLEAQRQKIPLTLEEMAARLGVATSTIQRWEKGENTIPNKKLDEVAAAYKCRVGEIYTDDANPVSNIVALPPALPNEAALAVALQVILEGAGVALPAATVRPSAAALRLCLELLRDIPAIHANDDVIKAVARGVIAQPHDPKTEA